MRLAHQLASAVRAARTRLLAMEVAIEMWRTRCEAV